MVNAESAAIPAPAIRAGLVGCYNRMDVLVLALGGNDGLRGIPAQVTDRLQLIIERARGRYPAGELIIAGIQMPRAWGRITR